MKKILAIILAVLMCISSVAMIASCSNKNDTETPTTENTTPTQTEAPTDAPTELPTEEPTEEPTDEVPPELTTLDEALAYVHQLYKDMKYETAANYDLLKSVIIGDVVCNVEWSIVGTDKVTITDKDDRTVTVVVPELGDSAIEYTLKATITLDGETGTKEYAHVVPKFKVTTFAEYAAAEDDALVIVEGIVTGIISKATGSNANGLYLQDLNNEGGYYVYGLAEDPNGVVEVGMKLQVSGAKDNYNGTYEIVNASYKILDDGAKTPVAPVDYTAVLSGAAKLSDEALVGKQGMLVTVKGVTVGEPGDNGYYYFMLGAHKTYLRISSSNNPTTDEALETIKTNFAANYGNKADVTGVISIYNGNFYLSPVSADAFANFVMPDRTDAEKVAFELDALKVDSQINSDKTVTLAATGAIYSDVVITWTSNSEFAVVNGANVTFTIPDDATDVVLTATATINGVTATKTFTVKLSKTLTSVKDAIELGASKEHNVYTDSKYLVGGIITEIYNEQYGNMKIKDAAGNILTIYGTYSADGSTRFDSMEKKPVVGDYIIVLGIIGQYNGTPQVKNGWIQSFTTTTSVKDAIDLGASKDHNVYTDDKYLVVGEVTEIYNETYGNLKIKDAEGNILTVYGTYSEDGKVRFDNLDKKPAVGDTIAVYGIIGQYNGTPQLKNGWIMSIEAGSGDTPGTDDPVTPPAVDYVTDKDALDALYALESGASADGDYKITGVITALDSYGNPTIVVGDYTTMPVYCYRLTDSRFVVGATVTVTAKQIKNYNGTYEFMNCTVVSVGDDSGSTTPDEPVTPPTGDPTPDTELSVEAAIALGASKEHNTYTSGKYYVKGEITEIYNTTYGNMKIRDAAGNILTIYGTYNADGSTRFDAMETKPAVGDTIIVYGIIGQYNGTAQIKNGWIVPSIPEAPVTPPTPPAADPTPDTELSVEAAIALGASKEHNTYTSGKYYVKGEITEIYNTTYGNMKIRDAAGNILTIYGTYNADGSTRFDAMETKPAVGDTIIVYGIIGQYNGTAQIKNGWIVPSIPETPPVTPEEPEGEKVDVKYTFSEMEAGEQYASENRVLDDNTTLITTDCHITTELRIYKAEAGGNAYSQWPARNGVAIIKSVKPLKNIVLNLGGKKTTFTISASVDGVTYVEVATIEVTSTDFNEFVVDLGDAGYKYVKLETASQGRVKYFGLNFAEVTAEDFYVAEKPVEGTKYNFVLFQGAAETFVLVNGLMNGYYMDTTADAAAALNFYVEATEGGYYLYTMMNGYKIYLNMVVSGTHVNAKYEPTPSTVYTYDEALKTLVATVNEKTYAFGTRSDKTYTTIGPVVADQYDPFLAQFALSTNEDAAANEPKPGAPITTDDALDILANLPTYGATTTNKYGVKGTVVSVDGTTITIKDANGNTLVIKNVLNATGSAAVENMPVVGDTIVVLGALTNVGGNAMVDGWLQSATTHTCDMTVATCKTPSTCTICGKVEGTVSAEHTDWVEATCAEAAHCTVCGKVEGEKLADCQGWVAPTCSEYGYCTVCGKVGTELDADNHTNVIPATCREAAYCVDCETYIGEKDPTAHGEITKATCILPETCKLCGMTFSEVSGEHGEIVDCECTVCGATIHTGELSVATCMAASVCGDCGQPTGEKNPANHVGFSDATCTTPATCECGVTDGDVDPDAHKYVDCVCEYCGGNVHEYDYSNGGVCPNCENVDPRYLTLPEANTLGAAQGSSSYTTDKYIVWGIITKIDNSTYGNVWIKDLEGNEFYVYGLYTQSGTRYDKMSPKPVVGDTITLLSGVGNHYGSPQMKNATVIEHVVHTTCDFADATCKAPETCIYCGKTQGDAIDHIYADGVCTMCGKEEGAADPVTVTAKHSSTSTTNMSTGNQAATLGLDASIFTVTADKGGHNLLPGLNKDGTIRLYHSETNGNSLTFTVASGKTIQSVKITFSSANYSKTTAIIVGGTQVAKTGTNGDATLSVDINASSFTIQNVGGTAQVRIKSIEIVYA